VESATQGELFFPFPWCFFSLFFFFSPVSGGRADGRERTFRTNPSFPLLSGNFPPLPFPFGVCWKQLRIDGEAQGIGWGTFPPFPLFPLSPFPRAWIFFPFFSFFFGGRFAFSDFRTRIWIVVFLFLSPPFFSRQTFFFFSFLSPLYRWKGDQGMIRV